MCTLHILYDHLKCNGNTAYFSYGFTNLPHCIQPSASTKLALSKWLVHQISCSSYFCCIAENHPETLWLKTAALEFFLNYYIFYYALKVKMKDFV